MLILVKIGQGFWRGEGSNLDLFHWRLSPP